MCFEWHQIVSIWASFQTIFGILMLLVAHCFHSISQWDVHRQSAAQHVNACHASKDSVIEKAVVAKSLSHVDSPNNNIFGKLGRMQHMLWTWIQSISSLLTSTLCHVSLHLLWFNGGCVDIRRTTVDKTPLSCWTSQQSADWSFICSLTAMFFHLQERLCNTCHLANIFASSCFLWLTTQFDIKRSNFTKDRPAIVCLRIHLENRQRRWKRSPMVMFLNSRTNTNWLSTENQICWIDAKGRCQQTNHTTHLFKIWHWSASRHHKSRQWQKRKEWLTAGSSHCHHWAWLVAEVATPATLAS